MAYYVTLQPCCYHQCWYYSQYFENKTSFRLCSPWRKQRQIGEIRHLGNEERALCVYLWIVYLLYFHFGRVDSFFFFSICKFITLCIYNICVFHVYFVICYNRDSQTKNVCANILNTIALNCWHFKLRYPLWLVNLEDSAVMKKAQVSKNRVKVKEQPQQGGRYKCMSLDLSRQCPLSIVNDESDWPS